MVVIGQRQGGFHPAVVAEPHVQVVVLAQPVGGVVSAYSQVRHVDDHVQRIQVVRCLGAEKLLPQDVQAGQRVDVLPHLPGQGERGIEQMVSVLDHLPAPAVQRRVDHHVRAGCHQHVGTGGQLVRIDEVALPVEH